jgi:DNA (cytosine-5)-methyltransferase 1
MVRFGSLFAGIGGFDLGLERAGMTCAWQVENDPYANRVLAKHWPNVPRYGDIREVDWSEVERVDLVCGGFPCQDISSAGAKGGLGGDRSGLWSEYVRCIRAVRPSYVLIENVADLVARGLGTVLGDLAALGFDAEWHCIPAVAAGAPIGARGRDRVWIVAHTNGLGLVRPGLPREARWELLVGASGGRCAVPRLPDAASDHWKAEPGVGRVADGVPSRLDRLRGLGNAVVPQVAEYLGRAILAAEQLA